ncbi:signal recognition particle-docking protein FtsY [Synechococcus sp. CS-197]|uniref:signal recognition particle-docking protein FtsY n=1 Tax=Synechococcus sp. CS-197 TaxID=2847985 RepID=UPI0001525803|nr:signal recognition particle-docking protein FtsY [Synechococcus sp. CS-197]MCT0251128.1 signal recognition particle-docking protein FtsY [Synechococcus sp. CS-197]CAK22437.1 Signal recognition particle GTPase, FtsY [Synechococcus sp. WH 7803]
MVYDWFNRQSEAAPTPPPADDSASAQEPQQDAAASADDDPLEWARQAYARLKAQKEQANATPAAPQSDSPAEPETKPEPEPEREPEQEPAPADPEPTPVAGLSLLEQAAAQRQERQQQLEQEPQVAQEPVAEQPVPAASVEVDREQDEPSLGAFDDTFTWSAEVLAAQGREAEQVTLEEIDWLGRLRQGLEKTRQGFVSGLLENLGDDPLTPEVLDDLESLLLRADAGVKATDQVLDALRKRMNEQVVDPSEGIRFLKEQLRDLLEAPIKSSGVDLLAPQRGQLNVWLMVGVNGVGKTTTLGKLANLAVRSGYSAMIAAADTFRAAAVQQVQVWGDRSDVPVVANPSDNADPAAVVFDAIGAARSKGTDLVLVDTAGRLQTKHNLMEELNKIRRVVDRLAPDATVESLLVLDASQGQNGLKQAMAFARAAGLTGVVITKLDGTARGGVALAVASEAGLPIRFIGAGEGIRDLRPFNSFEFVEALLASR